MNDNHEIDTGMSLRDFLAAHVLAHMVRVSHDSGRNYWEIAAVEAYKGADAMMWARKLGPEAKAKKA